MKDFFRTLGGRRFFEGDIPALVKALQDISEQMKIANELKQREIKFNEKMKIMELSTANGTVFEIKCPQSP